MQDDLIYERENAWANIFNKNEPIGHFSVYLSYCDGWLLLSEVYVGYGLWNLICLSATTPGAAICQTILEWDHTASIALHCVFVSLSLYANVGAL